MEGALGLNRIGSGEMTTTKRRKVSEHLSRPRPFQNGRVWRAMEEQAGAVGGGSPVVPRPQGRSPRRALKQQKGGWPQPRWDRRAPATCWGC